jgi:Asp-tRNA(Asn)/Glu-tRNA(Gln) amidotransferase A subunit family amidase
MGTIPDIRACRDRALSHNPAMTARPIERAARALHDRIKPGWNWDDPDSGPLRQAYQEAAQAVLAAVREPPEEAVEIGMEVVKNVHLGMSEAAYRDDTIEIWHMMLDATSRETR